LQSRRRSHRFVITKAWSTVKRGCHDIGGYSNQTVEETTTKFKLKALKFEKRKARGLELSLATMAASGGTPEPGLLDFLMGNAVDSQLSYTNLIQLFINHIRLGYWSLAESVLPQLAQLEPRGCLALLNTLIDSPTAVDWYGLLSWLWSRSLTTILACPAQRLST
jgi:hypothetical protein